MSRYYERRTGDWEQCYLLGPADHNSISTFFEFVPNGTLGFQIKKIRIWIESIESFLGVDSMDSKSFFGFAQKNGKSIFGFEILIWILTKGTYPQSLDLTTTLCQFQRIRKSDKRVTTCELTSGSNLNWNQRT